jgi:predicted phosphodiesterase
MSLADRADGRRIIAALAEHLERSGITVDEIGRVSKLGGYQGLTKDPETGEATIHDLHKWEISPAFTEGPSWQPVDRGPAVRLPKRSTTPSSSSGWSTAIVWPDTQIGYYRGADGELVATHDEAAIEVALAIVRAVAPDLVVRVGDDLDLPELGKYRTTPAFAGTTQASIDRSTILAAEQRDAAGPDATIVYLAGNHEERLSNYVLDNARAAYGLRRGRFVEEAPAAWPVFSVPYLCRLDEFGVEYRPGFPASDVEIGTELRAVHGLHVTSRGQTATKYLDREKSSIVYGHIHRREFAARTFVHNGTAREIFAASPGCLARLDGAVPSTKGGTDLDGRPILGRPEDWQQGVGVVHHRPGAVVYENVAISADGPVRWAFYGGKTYEGGSDR